MVKYLFAIIFIIFPSCCGLHTEVKYMYQGVTIIRIDECGMTSFYYKNKQNKASGRIWVVYSGINDGFDGYLKFDSTKRVALLAGDGYFKSENLDTTLFRLETFKSYERPEIGQSVCYISLSTRYEKEGNAKAKSGVIVEYNIDNNEWW